MFSASSQTHNSQSSRTSVLDQQQHHPQYTASAVYSQPSISHHPPTPSGPTFQPQAAAPGAFAPHHPSHFSQSPELLRPSNQRARSSSPNQSVPESTDLRRSQSLNDTMSNPQTGYYPMAAAPMGGYQQHQLYSQGPMAQSSYYQGLPQSPVPISSAYVEQARQSMQPMGYDYSMQFSQASYPPAYATSYAGNSSVIAPSYGSPVASQQFPRPGQPAALAGAPVQVVDRAKKPQCWDHGCNGREFSTFSNLLRHQREKSGTAAKSYCPHCGAEFTRTTARNGHMEHGKCKTRRAASGTSS